MSKHTPGPWIVNGYAGPDGEYPGIMHERRDSDGKVIHAEQVMPFYDCDPTSSTYARHMADKRLIEASPDLLAALKALVAEFDRYDEAMSKIGRGHEDYGLQRQDARIAIAKAEGRA